MLDFGVPLFKRHEMQGGLGWLANVPIRFGPGKIGGTQNWWDSLSDLFARVSTSERKSGVHRAQTQQSQFVIWLGLSHFLAERLYFDSFRESSRKHF